MITPAYVQLMAEYNQWMNDKLYACATELSEEQLLADRGAFFKSVHGTLKHLMWADGLWLSRFLGTSGGAAVSN
ncbi:MAG TPA: DinB family protein, partial [Methylophilaceae bacterium]